MARQRDYAAEYARRKELAAERGLSLSQARGHARASEEGVATLKRAGTLSQLRSATLERVYRAAALIGLGVPLDEAARRSGTTVATLTKAHREANFLNPSRVVTTAPGRHRFVGPVGLNVLTEGVILTADGTNHGHVPLDPRNSSVLGQYWSAIRNGDAAALRSFKGRVIYGLDGRRYELLTDLDAIRHLEVEAGLNVTGDYFHLHYQRQERAHVV